MDEHAPSSPPLTPGADDGYPTQGVKNRFGYETHPKTVEGLLVSALGNIEAREDPGYDWRVEGVVPTSEAMADLCCRLVRLERSLASIDWYDALGVPRAEPVPGDMLDVAVRQMIAKALTDALASPGARRE